MTPLRILFLTDNFPPEVNAPASRTFEHCREWVRAGVAVTVITGAPNFPQGKVQAGYRNRLWQREEMEGIRVIRVWTYITANEGFVKRTLDYISFALMGSLAALLVRTDLIVATSPQFFTALGGWWAALLKRKKWVMEVRDLWPESIRAVGAMREGRLYRWLERCELFLYRQAAAVVVVTESFRADLVRRGICSDKVFVVKNGVLLDAFSPRERDALLARRLGLEGKFVVGYLGTHGMAHRLDFILNCAAKCPQDLHFLFIGDGAEKLRLGEQVARLHLSNVTLLPPVPKQEVARYISLTDVALVPLRKHDTFKTVLPSKIFENAALRRPILLGVEGEAAQLIEAYQAGACFEPENEDDFLTQLIRLQQDHAFYQHCQRGAARLSAAFDRRRLALDMLAVLTQL
ncbi:MAG TPA: glycosyltransferase family 4 protein [Saprospiraceae bacterium]|nr:glycosyltransferase family 4 protein [Saprospiraceae bacterium]